MEIKNLEKIEGDRTEIKITLSEETKIKPTIMGKREEIFYLHHKIEKYRNPMFKSNVMTKPLKVENIYFEKFCGESLSPYSKKTQTNYLQEHFKRYGVMENCVIDKIDWNHKRSFYFTNNEKEFEKNKLSEKFKMYLQKFGKTASNHLKKFCNTYSLAQELDILPLPKEIGWICSIREKAENLVPLIMKLREIMR